MEEVGEAAGLDREQVIERRAGIMSAEFLGFTPEHVFMQRPDLAGSDEIEVDGETVEIPRFRPDSWYVTDLYRNYGWFQRQVGHSGNGCFKSNV